MNIEEIKELIQLAHDSGVAELEVQRGEHRVRIKRAGLEREVVIPAPAAPAVAAVVPAAPAPAAEKDNLVTIKSPIVGTFY
ncbi:MAG: acetyl-CoA carboxylase, biotin carboxyl carrier protein, partial [Acidobacteria bacterium]|nr:acetyl-CoA carboxylase, biotin carboxyl carrier protein [Acidobacteriota bacterium]